MSGWINSSQSLHLLLPWRTNTNTQSPSLTRQTQLKNPLPPKQHHSPRMAACCCSSKLIGGAGEAPQLKTSAQTRDKRLFSAGDPSCRWRLKIKTKIKIKKWAASYFPSTWPQRWDISPALSGEHMGPALIDCGSAKKEIFIQAAVTV